MKQVLTLTCLCMAFALHAQTFFQDFEDGIEPMVLYDVDGLTPHQNVAGYPNAWNVVNPTFGNGTNVAVSTSWYTPVGIANDWMVTPQIQLPDSNVIIRWEAKAQDASFRDGYIVYISTTGNTPADFTEILYQTAAEQATWQTRQIDLADYAGQGVYVAFRNNSNDKFLLLVDNIFIGEQKQRDVSLSRVSANINRNTTLEGPRNVEITVQNFGLEAITSIDATWHFNGESMTHKETGLNIASGASVTFTHDVPLNYVVGTGYQLMVTIDSINGQEDLDPSNNAFTSSTFKVLPPVPDIAGISAEGDPINLYDALENGQAVIFDFFASWCVPCEISTPALNDLYVANGSGDDDLVVIGITIEPADDDAAVNELDWGATYPSFSFSNAGYEIYTHYNNNHGLGESAIPFFIMICPNPDDPAHSEIIANHVGTGDIVNVFNNTWQTRKDDCIESLSSSVDNIKSLESYTVHPNPAYDVLNVEFSLTEPTELRMHILDVTGKILVDRDASVYPTGGTSEQIDVSNLANGTYFLRLTERSRVNTVKFTVVN